MRHLLPIIIVVFVIAGLAIFLFGDSGVLAYDGLAAYEESLSSNIDALKQHNAELNARLDRLRNDPESNLVLAHGIGLYRPDDAVVRLEGRAPRTETYTVGDLLRMRKDNALRNPVFKAIALGLCGLLLAWGFFSSRATRSRANGAQSR